MMARSARVLLLTIGLALGATFARADDGYRLWLRYERLSDVGSHPGVSFQPFTFYTPTGQESPTIAAARAELNLAIPALLGIKPEIRLEKAAPDPALGREGFAFPRRSSIGINSLTANSDVGVLYGVFALLRAIQTERRVTFDGGVPKIQHRILNHWDNLDGTIERGYAGRSLWEWDKLPGELSPRYRDYARACASIGINGTVLTNVNANAQVLTPDYIAKVAALANVFRPYGLKVYLTARFSAPIEIGNLKTADPLAPEVIAWWKAKAGEIYRAIPDFGGFLVKANSEGQPGPQAYNRTHADGANCLADAVAPHGGIVMWRAFVYDSNVPDDRHKQAFNEFTPLDGKFRANVVVQVKNGAIDFMPREPFHPLFGAMPNTPLALELQITQEYLGGSSELAFLAPLWREVLDADTFRPARGRTVARIVGHGTDAIVLGKSELPPRPSVIAGVANTGSDRNWCGHHLAAANWYAFGRLAWDHTLSPETIADEWTRMAFSNSPRALEPIKAMLLASHEAVVDYSMPLGLHHLMARDHHQGPGPWVSGGRPDWTSLYYHRADEKGLGFDRTASGSNALGQYAPEAARAWSDPATCPEEYLLWFHHVPWDHRMRSGRTLWDEMCLRYQRGVDTVRAWQKSWEAVAATGAIDEERAKAVRELLAQQEKEARIWRDACTLYFATFSKRPLPGGVEPPEHPLDYYRRLREPFKAEMK